MAVTVAPTKPKLHKAKSSLARTAKGHDRLAKKRNVLIKEMMSWVNRARIMHNEIYVVLEEAYGYLQWSNVTMGVKNVEDFSYSVPVELPYDILLKSVMGIDIPTIKYKRDEIL